MTSSCISPNHWERLDRSVVQLFALLTDHPYYDPHLVSLETGEFTAAYRLAPMNEAVVLIDDHSIAVQLPGDAHHTRMTSETLTPALHSKIEKALVTSQQWAIRPVQQQFS